MSNWRTNNNSGTNTSSGIGADRPGHGRSADRPAGSLSSDLTEQIHKNEEETDRPLSLLPGSGPGGRDSGEEERETHQQSFGMTSDGGGGGNNGADGGGGGNNGTGLGAAAAAGVGGRKLLYYSPTLASGSSDKLRNAFGGNYQIVEDVGNFVATLESTNTSYASQWAPTDSLISETYVLDAEDQVAISSELIYNSVKTPILFVGDEGKINDDLEWETFIIGGSYSTSVYDGISTSAVFDGLYNEITIPYEKLESKILKASRGIFAGVNNFTTIENQYQTYLSSVEEKGSSIYELPNFYFLSTPSNVNLVYDDDVKNYLNLEGQYTETDLEKLFIAEPFSWPAVHESVTTLDQDTYDDTRHNINEYFRKWGATDYSSSTDSYISQRMKNIIFDRDFISNLDVSNVDLMPFYINVNIPTFATSPNSGLLSAMINRGFDNMFLSILKKNFVDETPQEMPLAVRIEQDGEEEHLNETFRCVDLKKVFLNEMSLDYPDMSDVSFLTNSPLQYNLLTSEARYRNLRTTRTSLTLQAILNEIDSFGGPQFPMPTLMSYESWSLKDFLNISSHYATHYATGVRDVVAYRIEKMGTELGDGGTASSTVLQNFFFLNNNDGEEIQLYDSQVHYGAEYTYNIYLYVGVVSYKYKYENFAISQKTGLADPDNATSDRCLRLYSPATNEPVDSQWNKMKLSTTGPNPMRALGTEYSSMSEALSDNDYVAECMLEVEPYVKIYEIPIHSKTLSIIDNPPRQIDIIPFQRKDNSQVIGFFAEKPAPLGPIDGSLYPTPLNITEEELRVSYLVSNNLLEDEVIAASSVSALSHVQIFRLEEKPTQMSDFDGAMIAQKDLRLKQRIYPQVEEDGFRSTTQTSDVCFYEEKIHVNKTYYYAFRFLNEHGMPGRFSSIQELKLVSDGGYKYLESNSILQSELAEISETQNPSISFKKIFEIIPNINQIQFDTSDVDFTDTAFNQFENINVGMPDVDKVWGKTFKIRMTSKKTGKKIDLNVTYNLKDSV